jgi:hypothetical protein
MKSRPGNGERLQVRNNGIAFDTLVPVDAAAD